MSTTTTTSSKGDSLVLPSKVGDSFKYKRTHTPLDPQIAALEQPLRLKNRIDFSKDNWLSELVSRWSELYPPEITPGFLVDLGLESIVLPDNHTGLIPDLKWKVVKTQELAKKDSTGARMLYEQGWGCISYAWGEYQDKDRTKRTVHGDRLAAGLPLAYGDSYTKRFQRIDDVDAKVREKGNEYDWIINKIDAVKVETIQKIFVKMGKRFVWWDMACIPQAYYKRESFEVNGTKLYLGPKLTPELLVQQDAEVLKQRFVYSYASVGALWLVKQDFKSDSKLRQMLDLMPIVDPTDVDQFFEIKIDEKIDEKTRLEKKMKILRSFLSAPVFGNYSIKPGMSEADKATVLNNLKTRITSLRDLFLAVRNDANEAYFRSLWSFQEIRLLKNQYFVDKNAATYNMDFTSVSKDKSHTPKQEANFLHLTSVVEFFCSQVSLALAASTEISDTKRAALEANPDLVILAQKDAPFVRQVLADVKGSAMAFAPQETPLQVLAAARRSRFPNTERKDNYFGLQGVLALDGDFGMKLEYNKVDDFKDPAKDTIPLNKARQEFFKRFVQRFQWDALMLAKAQVDDVVDWTAVSLGHFEPISAFFEGFIFNNFATMSSPRYMLPTLAYNYDDKNDSLDMVPFTGNKSFEVWKLPGDLSAAKTLLYTLESKPDWYNIDRDPKATTTKSPSEIAVSGIVSPRALTNDMQKNANRFLIPIQPLNDTWSPLALASDQTSIPKDEVCDRCLLVEQVSGDAKMGVLGGVFGGIVDVRGMKLEKFSDAVKVSLAWQKKV